MKKRLFLVGALLLVSLSVTFYSCEDEEYDENRGRKAAKEFCDCLDDGYTMKKCNEKFESKYKYEDSEAFIDGFNAEGAKCGISASRKYSNTKEGVVRYNVY